ncbi:hypothetical protein ACFP65_05390 [Marinilactibacillus sp. GCM10026970]|uniref:hypothetical protein n=1 Tax=Marinilactibacillus sp. GCM10026970 TaxID=3252642 RepID=UPI00361D0C6E
MSKKNIRILALGFFISGLLLALFYVVFPTPSSASSQTDEVEELRSEVSYLQNKIAEMEVAQVEEPVAEAQLEASEEQPEEETEENNEEQTENTDIEETEEAAEEENQEEEVEEDPVVTTTVTIGDGQPSSVAASQLLDQNIIEDRFDFDRFLEDNNYAPLVRPGSYEIRSDMSYEEIAQALMGR